MGKRPPEKMPLSQRAKQFAPFDALRGFREAISSVNDENSSEERLILSSSQLEELNGVLLSLEKGSHITLKWYHGNRYITISGVFGGFDENLRRISLSGKSLPLDEIDEIRKIK
ncbi:MAG: hypothetical protein IKH73_07940 [Erysipelotrichaceae bacterium]|nr:hypothetical protein [Erysipelotrichaceae bacterium]